MSRTITRITKEGRVNYAIKNRKSKDFQMLFYSTWDELCQKMMGSAEKWAQKEGDEDLLTVNSWDLPHAFMAFKITKVPCLVTCRRGRITKLDYAPLMYKHFNSAD
jgi:thiol-disulfide isomerase/thioredoxin